MEKLGRFKSTFTPQQEQDLADHSRDLDTSFYGLTFKDLRRLAFQFAEANNISHRFDKESKLAGKDWALTFMKKYRLSLRTPQQTSLARIMGFNKVQLEVFFNNLSEIMVKFKFTPDRIYNMDESGMSTVPNHVPKVISSTGKRAVGIVSSAERGQLITAICAMSATGNYIPPSLIFKRKRGKPELMNGAPPSSVMFTSDSGYVNSELFVEWIKHFQTHAKATKDSPVLLILDNHSSHLSLDAVLFCRQNGIHLLSIPPHSSHKLQPLDRCFFKPLKTYFSEACNHWLISNPGRVITQFQMAALFGTAYLRCASVGKAVNAFKTCGIVPLDPAVFTDEDFAPSAVTDIDLSNNDLFSDQPSTSIEQTISNQPPNFTNISNRPSTSSNSIESSRSTNSLFCNLPTNDLSSDSESDSPLSSLNTIPQGCVSPSDIRPLPKRKEQQQRRKKGQKSEIITNSPFKSILEAKAEDMKKKTSKKVLFKRPAPVKRRPKSLSSYSPNVNSSSSHSFTKAKKIKGTMDKDVSCPVCEEQYDEPPDEDWIMCRVCKDWWHEACSNYEGNGHFVCDYC